MTPSQRSWVNQSTLATCISSSRHLTHPGYIGALLSHPARILHENVSSRINLDDPVLLDLFLPPYESTRPVRVAQPDPFLSAWTLSLPTTRFPSHFNNYHHPHNNFSSQAHPSLRHRFSSLIKLSNSIPPIQFTEERSPVLFTQTDQDVFPRHPLTSSDTPS